MDEKTDLKAGAASEEKFGQSILIVGEKKKNFRIWSSGNLKKAPAVSDVLSNK